jgi:hypothetical protein
MKLLRDKDFAHFDGDGLWRRNWPLEATMAVAILLLVFSSKRTRHGVAILLPFIIKVTSK